MKQLIGSRENRFSALLFVVEELMMIYEKSAIWVSHSDDILLMQIMIMEEKLEEISFRER
jgi:hypothetical protein